MADAIVTIPLPGQPMARQAGSEDDHNGRAVVGHFFAGPENQLLEPAIHGVLQRRPALYNPLVLHGPSGTGKSHLARGLLAAWRDRFPPASVVYTTAVDFARELADAIETQAVADLQSRYRTACLLVFEDVGRLADKPAAQVELIHTIDAVMQEGGQVVVTAAVSPGELRNLMPALQSRLLAGLAVALCATRSGCAIGHRAAIGCPARHRIGRAGCPGPGRWAGRHGAGVAGCVGAVGRAGPAGRPEH